MRSQCQHKDDEIEEHVIREGFLQEEFERANREQVRWKERYDAMEAEEGLKKQILQAKYEELEQRVAAMGVHPEGVPDLIARSRQLQDAVEEAQRDKVDAIQRIKALEEQVGHREAAMRQLEEQNKEIQSTLAAMHKEKLELADIIRLQEADRAKLESSNKELQSSIASMQREKVERQKVFEQQILALETHNKELQSTLATTHRDKADLAEKLRTLECSPRKSQIEQSSAALESKYKTQLAHEQTLREALILQAVSVKEVEHMEKIRALTEAHNRRMAAMEQSFEKKLKGWQNSHDDKFLEELARVTEENTLLKDRIALAEKDKERAVLGRPGELRKGMEVIRTRELGRRQ